MKRLKYLIVLGIMAFTALLAPIVIYGNDTAEAPGTETTAEEETDNRTWLARQLETYGVPAAISTIIGGSGVGGAIWLVTRLFRKKNKEILSALKELGLTQKALDAVTGHIKEIEIRLKNNETNLSEKLNTMHDLNIVPLVKTIEILAKDLTTVKGELRDGALKIIKLLTEAEKNEKENTVDV